MSFIDMLWIKLFDQSDQACNYHLTRFDTIISDITRFGGYEVDKPVDHVFALLVCRCYASNCEILAAAAFRNFTLVWLMIKEENNDVQNLLKWMMNSFAEWPAKTTLIRQKGLKILAFKFCSWENTLKNEWFLSNNSY